MWGAGEGGVGVKGGEDVGVEGCVRGCVLCVCLCACAGMGTSACGRVCV